MLRNRNLILLLLVLTMSCRVFAQDSNATELRFNTLPDRWDRGFPLGNGMTGILVWQMENKLRLSIDRADLWDLRPMADIGKYTYAWAYAQRLKGEFDTVWQVADVPYERDPAPSKIPGAAIEFDISSFGPIETSWLDLNSAVCTIRWKNGIVFRIFVDATSQLARYSWEGAAPQPALIPPDYTPKKTGKQGPPGGGDLSRLGYPEGRIRTKKNQTLYQQQGYAGFRYECAVNFTATQSSAEGCIAITSNYKTGGKPESAAGLVSRGCQTSFADAGVAHREWWKGYGEKSTVSIPDPILQKQYNLEMYKFGSASRKGAPPITLQAVWTADNGKLPPWKGDFHHDLNTQLSYWPAYASNHAEEAAVFTDWLWEHKSRFEAYAKQVFNVGGLNVPGVSTLDGAPMGGWHMYSLSPTAGAWLAQHFYLQWRYTGDRKFLADRAYPWLKETAEFLEQLTVTENGVRKLPMSSSPEFRDNRIDAWYLSMSNYDLALCRFAFAKAAELADELGLQQEANHWRQILSQFGTYDLSPDGSLSVAKDVPMNVSHRHFSHLMAYHPLGLLNYDQETDRDIIRKTVNQIVQNGSSAWCGYSFSWLASLYARMEQGDSAAAALRTFASCYCSPNSFHLNNNLCEQDPSGETGGPFTLEGNFAFAAGLQEMLLQSYDGIIRIFPALPASWKDASFSHMRTEGAFLVNASRKNGVNESFTLEAPEGGIARIRLPFRTFVIRSLSGAEQLHEDTPGILLLKFEKGGKAVIENGYE
jgi:alpha-L-fucosidase 2